MAGRSPFDRMLGRFSCGGYFAPELRYAGYDGIIIVGRAPRPSLLLIEDDQVRIVDASEYWGKGIEEVNRSLKKRFGRAYRTLVIGPAGENLVSYALILNEGHHAFGRAGFGAVMGSKNLKAIVVKAKTREHERCGPEEVRGAPGGTQYQDQGICGLSGDA